MIRSGIENKMEEYKYYVEIYKADIVNRPCFVDLFPARTISQAWREANIRMGNYRFRENPYLINIRDKNFNISKRSYVGLIKRSPEREPS